MTLRARNRIIYLTGYSDNDGYRNDRIRSDFYEKISLLNAAKKAQIALAVMAVCGMSFVGADKAYADSVDELRADLNKEINARAEGVLGMGIAIGVLTDKDNALDSKLDAEIAARIGADAA